MDSTVKTILTRQSITDDPRDLRNSIQETRIFKVLRSLKRARGISEIPLGMALTKLNLRDNFSYRRVKSLTVGRID